MTETITLTGWTHVHTWHESHGNYSDHIYQRDIIRPYAWSPRRVELLHVTVYHDSMYGSADRPTGFRVETQHAHDYLLARDIRANAEGRYKVLPPRHISPCCTAGAEDFRDVETDDFYRVFGAAGHGEWAFRIEEEDLKPFVF